MRNPAISSAASQAINAMHAQFGRCRVSAWWSEQPRAVKEGICRAAALKPAAYWGLRLDEMDEHEREAIRRAVVAMQNAIAGFNATSRREWLAVHQAEEKQAGAIEQADKLSQRLNALNAKSPASGN